MSKYSSSLAKNNHVLMSKKERDGTDVQIKLTILLFY